MSDYLGLYAGHDANAAFVRDGILIAATEEERLTGQKHVIGTPAGAALDVLNLAQSNGDYKIVAASPHLDKLNGSIHEVIDHHHAHAAYAYCTSGFDDAKVVVIDGGGANSWAGIYYCQPGEMLILTETTMQEGGCPFGQLYGRVTSALGFRVLHDEGKIMGLAAYGNPARFEGLFNNAYVVYGQYIYANPDYDWLKMLAVVKENKQPGQREHIAAALQDYFIEIMVNWIKATVNVDDSLCVAGGVFANVKLNQYLLTLCNRLYVAPAMNDGGLAAGAALYAAGLQPRKQHNVFLGLDLGQLDINPQEIAQQLAEGQIIALAHGKMEYGPRALGNRSILAHPGIEGMTDTLNQRLNRQEFMPFAPVILEEYAADILLDYTDLDNQPSARHMTLSYDISPEWLEPLVGVVHIDGTVRPQVITQEAGLYYEILKEFYNLTGLPALINTSFNLHNQPIIRTAEQAHKAAKKADLILYLGK